MISGIYFHVDVDLEYDWQPHVALVSWHSRSWGLLFLSMHVFLQSFSYENVSVTEKSCSHTRTVCWLQMMQGNMVFHIGIWINVLSETQFPHLPNESGDCKVVWSMQELVCVTCCVYTQQGHITYKPQMNCIWLLSCLWYRSGPGCSLSLSRANLFYILKPNEELE